MVQGFEAWGIPESKRSSTPEMAKNKISHHPLDLFDHFNPFNLVLLFSPIGACSSFL